jgi:hypothetical protein
LANAAAARADGGEIETAATVAAALLAGEVCSAAASSERDRAAEASSLGARREVRLRLILMGGASERTRERKREK